VRARLAIPVVLGLVTKLMSVVLLPVFDQTCRRRTTSLRAYRGIKHLRHSVGYTYS